MAETDNNMQAESVDNSLKMRNTETSALKRMTVSANAASASSAARKTIKLKPLVSSTSSNPGVQAAPASSSRVAPPSILLNRKPAAQPADQAPKFMSTNTAPIVKMTKPDAEKPVQSDSLNEKPSAATITKTVSIPRFQGRNPSAVKAASSPVSPSATTIADGVSIPKKVQPSASGTAAASAPAISTATVATPRITSHASPASPAAPVSPASTASASMPKISVITGTIPKINRSAAAAGSVKPTYISTATAAVPKAGAAPAPGPMPTITQGIQRQAINQAKMQSGLQEAKPAIKLRPSASPDASPENLSPASPTIKLSPKADSTVSPMPSNAQDSAAAPGREEITVTTKIPRAKLQLRPTASSVSSSEPPPQARLREQGDISNKLKDQSSQEENQTISQSAEVQEEKPAENAAPEVDEQKNEPNIIFAVCAILAFLVIGYTVFALTAQYLNTWEQKKIPVVGFEQINKK